MMLSALMRMLSAQDHFLLFGSPSSSVGKGWCMVRKCVNKMSHQSIGSAHITLRDTSVIVKHSDLSSVLDVSFFFLFSFGSFLFFFFL